MPLAATIPNMAMPAPPSTAGGIEATRKAAGWHAEEDQETGGGHRDVAAAHPGHLHQADVLGERGMGEGVQEAGEERGAGVAEQAAAQFGRGDLAAGDLAQGEEHAGGLDEDDHYHQAIDRIGARSKVGAPKCSGVTMSNQGRSARPPRSTMPMPPAIA